MYLNENQDIPTYYMKIYSYTNITFVDNLFTKRIIKRP